MLGAGLGIFLTALVMWAMEPLGSSRSRRGSAWDIPPMEPFHKVETKPMRGMNGAHHFSIEVV